MMKLAGRGLHPGGRQSGAGGVRLRSGGGNGTRWRTSSRLLGRMGEEIRLRRTSLPRLLASAGRGPGTGRPVLLRGRRRRRWTGESPWRQSWRLRGGGPASGGGGPVRPGGLGDSLQGDEEHICKAIELTSRSLAESLEETRSRRAETEKRAAALWLSAGALLVILLI